MQEKSYIEIKTNNLNTSDDISLKPIEIQTSENPIKKTTPLENENIKEIKISNISSILKKKKKWYNRIIPEIKNDSSLMAILILINTTMGSALLALPHAIAHFGLIFGIGMIFIAAINIRISLKCYSLILRRYECNTFSEMAKNGLNYGWGVAVNYIFSVYCWGTLTGYILVSKSMIELLTDPIFLKIYGDSFLNFKERFSFLYFFIPASMCLPFNLLANCDRLKWILKFGVFIVFFLAFVLFIQTPEFIKNTKIDYKMFNFNLDHILQSYGNFIYSFNTLVNIFIMKKNLKNPTKEKLSYIFNHVVIIILIFYLTISISGYLSLGQNSVKHDLIIERESIFKSDLLMKFSILLYLFQILLGYIIHVIPLKSQFFTHFKIQPSFIKNILLTLILSYIPSVLAWYYPHCKKLFSLLGSFFATFIVVTLPGMIMIKRLRSFKEDGFCIWKVGVWTAAFSFFGFLSGSYLTFKEIFGFN